MRHHSRLGAILFRPDSRTFGPCKSLQSGIAYGELPKDLSLLDMIAACIRVTFGTRTATSLRAALPMLYILLISLVGT